jgi:hypothetical protein
MSSVARKIFLGIVISACVLGITWYGWLFYISKGARKFDSANVFVTFHVKSTQCNVRKGLYATRHELPCEDVPSYVRDGLKLPVGATFAVSDLGNTHGLEIAALISVLEASGYRSVGSIRAFILEPEPKRQ